MTELFKRFQRSSVAMIHDLFGVAIAWFGAYWLRFNLEAIPGPVLSQAAELFPLIAVLQGGLFWYFGLYRGIWRFASIPDFIRILKAVAVGFLSVIAVVGLLTHMELVPRSIFPLYAVLALAAVGGPRLLYRWMRDYSRVMTGDRVLVIGAGDAGERIVRELVRMDPRRYQPVGFVDDDPIELGKEIHGVRVLGNVDQLPELVDRAAPDLIVIAVPSISGLRLRRIVEMCENVGVPFRILPRTRDLLSGKLNFSDLREVSIEDLLGRDEVDLEWAAIDKTLRGRTILVTGGGGSIGSELCRKIAERRPAKLVVLDNSEFNVYHIQRELSEKFPDLEVECHLVNICDEAGVQWTLDRTKPFAVFHAAAYKHVPMLENQIREALRVNVFGTRTVAQAAVRAGVNTFVMISTDKAVNPTNVMGASKRIAEIYCQNLDRSVRTHFITVRFGNVLGSAGSVVPLFKRQIREGGPVTVTDPQMERYFMTIPEASQLILQAATMGSGGEIFVLDMGEPIKITYLAEQMILLSGKTPGEDIEIEFTGLRPGEKLFEELFHEEEQLRATQHRQIRLARHRRMEWRRLTEALDRAEGAVKVYDSDKMYQVLRELVPEYVGGPLTPPQVTPLRTDASESEAPLPIRGVAEERVLRRKVYP